MSEIKRGSVAATPNATRRRFIAAAAGASALAFPMIGRGQAATGPTTMRWQSTWPTKDIFHEYALDYAKKVNDMTGGELKIDVLPAGAVVPAFGLLDAVHKGTLDGGHGVLVYWYGKQNALALWGSGPAYGMDSNMLLAWHYYGGGKQLLEEIYKSINMDVVSFPYGPMPTEPLGWYKKPIQKTADFKGLKFRTVGLGIELYTAMGASVNALPGAEIVGAMDRGLIEAAEFNNPSSDRALGFPDVSKVYMMKSFHQSAETFEILFNKKKYDALPEKIRNILWHAVEAASADMSWKAIDRYSQDYIDIQAKDKVKVYRTPNAVLTEQLKFWDQVCAKKSGENALFKKVLDSQKAYAERATKWQNDQQVDFKMAADHYFGGKKA